MDYHSEIYCAGIHPDSERPLRDLPYLRLIVAESFRALSTVNTMLKKTL